MVHDIEDQFRLNWLQDEYKPSKSDFEVHLKSTLITPFSYIAPAYNFLNFCSLWP
jgi:hypothetical protein